MFTERCCRVCFGPPTLPLFELHDGTVLGQMMADFADVLIAEGDGKPAFLCEGCGQKLKSSVDFQRQVREAENTIESALRNAADDDQMPKKIKLEFAHIEEDVYEYEFLDENTDEAAKTDCGENRSAPSGSPAMRNEELLKVLESSDNDDGDEDLFFEGEMNDEITLEDEQNKFPFLIPSEERIAQRLKFDNFEYLEIDGDRCCGCSFIAENRDELVQHSKDNHSQNYYADSGYTCPTCYRKFQSQEKLANHIEYYSYSDVFLCTICYESFVHKSHLKAHQESCASHQQQNQPHSPTLPLHVSQKATRRKRTTFTNHRPLQVNPTDEDPRSHFCCFVRCWEGFNTEEELLSHVHQVHEGKRRENELASTKLNPATKFTCLVCQRTFDTEKQLHVHISYKQKREEYICQECGKSCHKPSILRDHWQKEHTNLSPEFACDICGKAFWKLSVLKNHRKIHVPFENVPCSEPGCEMVFRDTFLMKRHCRNVHGDAPWHCRFCPKRLRTKEAIDIHERVHTGEKPFPCREGCDRRFAHATDRVRHERSMHTSEKPHKCAHCKEAYVRRRELVIHLQRHHNGEEN